MSEKLTITAQGAQIIPTGGNLQVTATTPEEMLHSNAALIEWCVNKIATTKAECQELCEARDHAKARKWKHQTLAKHAALSEKRVDFFVKMHDALVAGFYIVPNFPVQVFAIRTEATKPASLYTISRYRGDDSKIQHAEALSEGEGEYRNPFPIISERYYGKDDQQRDLYRAIATEWDKLEFPITMAKPRIMRATSRAMALKVFDEIGILQESKSGDPIIIGRMIDPRPTSSKLFRKHLSFIIAWHLDTKVL